MAEKWYPMRNQVVCDFELIKRYERSGARYRHIPPGAGLSNRIRASDYCAWAHDSNEEPIPRPLSLYLHIPFCSTVCYFCNSNKIVTSNEQTIAAYLEDLFSEIELHSKLYDSDRIVQQLHWGGGTPTILQLDQIRSLMRQIAQYFYLSSDDNAEYSIEVDPRNTDKHTVNVLRETGFNRLSVGVQDLNEQVQKAVNRIQSIALTQSVVDTARRADYKSINVDLIYGLPFQSVNSFTDTLKAVVDLSPDRITLLNYSHLPDQFPNQQHINVEDLPESKVKLDIIQFAVEHLTGDGYIHIGKDHFAKQQDELSLAQRKGSLYRNFQRYSAYAECDSVGMGISAISNIGNHYCQNTSDLKTYHEQLKKKKLPIFRGYYTGREPNVFHETSST